MVCPRCGGRLVFYELGDAETKACQDCIYVGIAVDHTSDADRPESWDDALSRFYEEHRTAPESKVQPVFETVAASTASGEATEQNESAAEAAAAETAAESPDAEN